MLLARGFTSDVYLWKDGQVLKLFHAGVPASKADREYRITRALHSAGLPVPATYEQIAVRDRFGIVFEHVQGRSMLLQVQARPWTLFTAVRQFADLHAQIHRCVSSLDLPSQREWIGGAIDQSAVLSQTEKEAAGRTLAELPDGSTLCHGDFHPENILCTKRGPIVIDWGAATRGDPLGDIACTSHLIQTASLPPWTPRYMHMLLRYSRLLIHRSYLNRSLHLHSGTRDQIRKWESLLAVARPWRVSPSTS